MASDKVSSLIELRRFLKPEQRPAWHLHIVQRELNGGKTSEADLAVLDAHPSATALTVCGLDQRSFEALVKKFGTRLSALHLWKCPRIESFAPLEDMPNLSHLAMFWNQRASRLWDLSKTSRLEALHFDDFTKLKCLDDLAGAASLRELAFGNAQGSAFEVVSIEPLGQLVDLRLLGFNVKSIADRKIQGLARLVNLEDLAFPAGQFTIEQIAWLRARLPETLRSSSLDALRLLASPICRRGKNLDVLVNGRGQPFLSSESDGERVRRFVDDFAVMVAEFRANPDRQPAAE